MIEDARKGSYKDLWQILRTCYELDQEPAFLSSTHVKSVILPRPQAFSFLSFVIPGFNDSKLHLRSF